ncbi:MAG: tetratricopeptide repeat protein [Okeania sp. SIO3B5]|uniref:tetratricopeptide repeat protein n=1 Tax=Okeania sp. SIO3B5 TaxID=2607811 RepID=UPI0013FFF007|nr:tetratricopeptide repeat protein [Okeania sp. SIO3B5]NEO55478.1 tetratricopeptide repeat protein [Okeania sp. SIO3B5]
MMKLNWKRKIQATLTLIIIGWATPVLSTPIHLLIDFLGNVQVKKAEWKDFIQAESVTTLSGEDEVMLGNNASVTVYCSDRNKWKVEKPGTYFVSEGCPEGKGVIRLCPDCNNQTIRFPGLREEKLKELPFLISPRYTTVFNDSLTIRWNEVSGATNYTVKVEGLEGEWEGETKENQIVYDGKLVSGRWFDVEVSADSGITSTNEYLNHNYGWFFVLKDEEAKVLREQVAVINQQELSQEQEGLILAYFYRGNRLNFEAIEVLEGLVKSGSRTATVYQLLGDTYQRVGLNLMAKKVYQQGLALTVEEERSEVKAMMQLGLGVVEYVLGNRDEAAEWLEKARVNYLVLGKRLNKEDEELINDVLGKD